jgi:hypothetical protein
MKWFLLICIFIIIGAGCILLGIDYDNLSDAWQGLAGSVTCFAAAGWMTWYCSKKNLLPE